MLPLNILKIGHQYQIASRLVGNNSVQLILLFIFFLLMIVGGLYSPLTISSIKILETGHLAGVFCTIALLLTFSKLSKRNIYRISVAAYIFFLYICFFYEPHKLFVLLGIAIKPLEFLKVFLTVVNAALIRKAALSKLKYGFELYCFLSISTTLIGAAAASIGSNIHALIILFVWFVQIFLFLSDSKRFFRFLVPFCISAFFAFNLMYNFSYNLKEKSDIAGDYIEKYEEENSGNCGFFVIDGKNIDFVKYFLIIYIYLYLTFVVFSNALIGSSDIFAFLASIGLVIHLQAQVVVYAVLNTELISIDSCYDIFLPLITYDSSSNMSWAIAFGILISFLSNHRKIERA